MNCTGKSISVGRQEVISIRVINEIRVILHRITCIFLYFPKEPLTEYRARWPDVLDDEFGQNNVEIE